jgi:hypothetical protein
VGLLVCKKSVFCKSFKKITIFLKEVSRDTRILGLFFMCFEESVACSRPEAKVAKIVGIKSEKHA